MSDIEDDIEFAWRARKLLAKHGIDQDGDSRCRTVEIHGLHIIFESSAKTGETAFSVYDYCGSEDAALYSEMPESLRRYTRRERSQITKHLHRLRQLMVLDDLANV